MAQVGSSGLGPFPALAAVVGATEVKKVAAISPH